MPLAAGYTQERQRSSGTSSPSSWDCKLRATALGERIWMSYLLHQLLTRAAANQSDHRAVVFRDHSLSYRELDELSNQLARLLEAHGVGKSDRVGICLGKSPEAVVAVFGILKAGAAYVPLDPASPARRLRYIVENCGMRALVTTGQKADSLRSLLGEPSP